MDRTSFKEEATRLSEAKKAEWMALLATDGEHLDEDGYPTELACEIIKTWHWEDIPGWFKFIESIWHLASWGWREGDEPHEWKEGEIVHRFHISTAGWSGNETLIAAMKQNSMLWMLTWVQSRRGGHYIFEIDAAAAAMADKGE